MELKLQASCECLEGDGCYKSLPSAGVIRVCIDCLQ